MDILDLTVHQVADHIGTATALSTHENDTPCLCRVDTHELQEIRQEVRELLVLDCC